jgi:hypothetical protein
VDLVEFTYSLRFLRLSLPTALKIKDPIHVWIVLHIKSSIPIFSLLQHQDLKENSFCKWIFRREDTHIWVMSLLTLKLGLLYRYFIGDWYSIVRDHFGFRCPYGSLVGDLLLVLPLCTRQWPRRTCAEGESAKKFGILDHCSRRATAYYIEEGLTAIRSIDAAMFTQDNTQQLVISKMAQP